MTDQELRKLSRNDLLELLLDQAKEIEELRRELELANRKLAERKIMLEKAGSIAEAALQLNGVFTAAQAACAQYVESVTEMYQQQEASRVKMEQETREKCERMIREAQRTADEYWEVTRKKVRTLFQSNMEQPDEPATASGCVRRQK